MRALFTKLRLNEIRTAFGVLATFILAISLLSTGYYMNLRTRLFLPSKTQAAETFQGVLEVIITDNIKGSKSETNYYLRTDNGARLKLQTNDTLNKYSGDRISLSGSVSGGTLTASSLTPEVNQLSQSYLGVRKMAVILINFQNDSSQPYTSSQVRNRVFTATDSVNAYYKEVSFNKFSLTGLSRSDGDVFGWYTIPVDNYPCDYDGSWTVEADKAVFKQGVDLAKYDHILYVFAGTAGCPWDGAGDWGGKRIWAQNGLYEFSTSTISHELGHNLGLGEGYGVYCYNGGFANQVPISNTCTFYQYEDPYDPMGRGYTLINAANFVPMHLNGYYKGSFGWLNPENTKLVTTSGLYTIFPIEKSSTGTQVLQIPTVFFGSPMYYYLEYRRPLGFDSYHDNSSSVFKGVSIRIADGYGIGTSGSSSSLIDTVPSNSGYNFGDAPLFPGMTFVDSRSSEPMKGIKIKTLTSDSNSATVEINFFPTPTPTPFCTDTDGGSNFSVKGTVTSSFCQQPQTDFCNGNVLQEQVCGTNKVCQVTAYTCASPQVCSNGACVTPTLTPTPTPIFSDNFNDNVLSTAWLLKNGTWSESGQVLNQASTDYADPKKALIANSGKTIPANQMIVAKVRVNSWVDGDSARAGVGLFTNTADGTGYNLVFHNNHSTVQFLDDYLAWGPSYTFNWVNNTWYWFKLKNVNGTLYGKVWQVGVVEPSNWPYTWIRSGRSGYPSLNGGSTRTSGGASSTSFDDVSVSSSY